jgi:hypothetical protein
MNGTQGKEGPVPEPSTIDGVLRALVEAMEAREAAEPDLPAWEANARLKDAESCLLRLYRECGPVLSERVTICIDVSSDELEQVAVEVA